MLCFRYFDVFEAKSTCFVCFCVLVALWRNNKKKNFVLLRDLVTKNLVTYKEGKEIVKAVPTLSFDSTSMVLLCDCIIAKADARPRPTPLGFAVK